MGIAASYPEAFDKAMLASGLRLPLTGKVFLSVRDEDKAQLVEVGKRLADTGFSLVATRGTARALEGAGIACEVVNKVTDGSPHCVDLIKSGQVAIVVNTTSDGTAIKDSYSIRRQALLSGIPYFTTIAAAAAASFAIVERKRRAGPFSVRSLQEYHADL
jgi:carbamoyl-phosphate synthase large subunit